MLNVNISVFLLLINFDLKDNFFSIYFAFFFKISIAPNIEVENKYKILKKDVGVSTSRLSQSSGSRIAHHQRISNAVSPRHDILQYLYVISTYTLI